MRITQQHQVDVMVQAIRDLQRHIFDRNEQIASGKRVNRPSDDPIAAERINQFRNVIRTTEHRLLSVEEGVSRLNLSDNALNAAGLTFQRAKELAIQMRNDTNSDVERRNTAQEVQQLILGLASIANTELNGRFILVGVKRRLNRTFRVPCPRRLVRETRVEERLQLQSLLLQPYNPMPTGSSLPHQHSSM